MATIFRIEYYKDGSGPYRYRNHFTEDEIKLLLLMSEEHDSSLDVHPGAADFDYIIKPSDLFAFDSINKLYSWFGKWIDYLFEMGFEIVTYEVEKYWIGKSGKQIIFNITDIISVNRMKGFIL